MKYVMLIEQCGLSKLFEQYRYRAINRPLAIGTTLRMFFDEVIEKCKKCMLL